MIADRQDLKKIPHGPPAVPAGLVHLPADDNVLANPNVSFMSNAEARAAVCKTALLRDGEERGRMSCLAADAIELLVHQGP